MKKALVFLTAWLLCLPAFAGRLNSIKLEVSNVTTNASEAAFDTADSDNPVTGRIKTIHVDLTGTSPNVDIDVIAVSGWSQNEVTLLSLDDVTTDATYTPRVEADTTGGVAMTNFATEINVLQQTLRLKAGDSDATNKTATVYILFETDD